MTHIRRVNGRYKNAIYFIYDKNNVFSGMDDSLAFAPFILSSIPHEKKVDGFPLDRLSIDIKTGKYYYDLGETAVDILAVVRVLTSFFENALSKIRNM